MTFAWETIVNQYLEGKALRAEVESLRMRLDLDPEARDEIEAVLRISDELAHVGKTMAEVPAGASERFAERLKQHFSAHAGELDVAAANRLARQLRGEPAVRTPRMPDVLAATIDENKDVKPGTDPSGDDSAK